MRKSLEHDLVDRRYITTSRRVKCLVSISTRISVSEGLPEWDLVGLPTWYAMDSYCYSFNLERA